ncbi:metal-dependent hydrolase [uncultured Clostridium sp.]|uniref:metal-dependent hydrolase n=1 Tax=uncultured Clostridium sp. TaxID=59620 RepID=UPI0026F3FAB8|nr:metal-dependent hydrolase [uncultured Clostridium sp.]
MIGKTHRVGGLAFGAVASSILFTGQDLSIALPATTVILTGSAFGSLIPDLDHAGAELSKKHKLASSIVRLFADHRGVTHYGITSIVFCAIMALLNYLVITSRSQLLIGILCVGVVQATIKLVFTYTPRWLTKKAKRKVVIAGFIIPFILAFEFSTISEIIIGYYLLGMGVGYISHLFLDSLTVSGVPFGKPWLNKNIKLGNLRTGEHERLVSNICYVITALFLCIIVL